MDVFPGCCLSDALTEPIIMVNWLGTISCISSVDIWWIYLVNGKRRRKQYFWKIMFAFNPLRNRSCRTTTAVSHRTANTGEVHSSSLQWGRDVYHLVVWNTNHCRVLEFSCLFSPLLHLHHYCCIISRINNILVENIHLSFSLYSSSLQTLYFLIWCTLTSKMNGELSWIVYSSNIRNNWYLIFIYVPRTLVHNALLSPSVRIP